MNSRPCCPKPKRCSTRPRKETGDKARDLRSQVEARLLSAKLKLQELEGEAVDRAKAAARVTDDYVHDHPWQAIGVAAGDRLRRRPADESSLDRAGSPPMSDAAERARRTARRCGARSRGSRMRSLGLARTRLELATIEYTEERARIGQQLALLLAGIGCVLFAVFFAAAAVVIYFWDTHRFAAILGVVMFFAGAGAAAAVAPRGNRAASRRFRSPRRSPSSTRIARRSRGR